MTNLFWMLPILAAATTAHAFEEFQTIQIQHPIRVRPFSRFAAPSIALDQLNGELRKLRNGYTVHQGSIILQNGKAYTSEDFIEMGSAEKVALILNTDNCELVDDATVLLGKTWSIEGTLPIHLFWPEARNDIAAAEYDGMKLVHATQIASREYFVQTRAESEIEESTHTISNSTMHGEFYCRSFIEGDNVSFPAQAAAFSAEGPYGQLLKALGAR